MSLHYTWQNINQKTNVTCTLDTLLQKDESYVRQAATFVTEAHH